MSPNLHIGQQADKRIGVLKVSNSFSTSLADRSHDLVDFGSSDVGHIHPRRIEGEVPMSDPSVSTGGEGSPADHPLTMHRQRLARLAFPERGLTCSALR